MKKRILAIALSVAMLLGILPFSMMAGAEEAPDLSTGLGDTAYSYLTVLDDKEYTLTEGIECGTIQDKFGRTPDKSAYAAGGDGPTDGYLFTKVIDGEGFIELDYNEAVTGDASAFIWMNGMRDGKKTPADLEEIDVSKVKYLAVRAIVEAETDGRTFMSMNIENVGGWEEFTADSEIYLVDNETRTWKKVTTEWLPVDTSDTKPGVGLRFDGDFNGWVVFDIESAFTRPGNDATANRDEKVLGEGDEFTAPGQIQFIFHNKCSGHSILGATGKASSWADRVFYLGDVLAVEDAQKFLDVRTSCDALGHDFANGKTTPPTCTEGAKTICAYCDEAQVTGTGTGHGTLEDANAKEATCTEKGYTGDKICSVCKEVVTAGTEIAATGHPVDDQIVDEVAAGNHTDGSKKVTCGVCEEVISEEVLKATCDGEAKLTDAKEATCTEDGYTGDMKCDKCGEVSKAGEVIEATGHEFGEWETTKEATATEKGEKQRECANCDEVETEEIPATGVVEDPEDNKDEDKEDNKDEDKEDNKDDKEEDKEADGNKPSSPNTGDNNSIMLWIAIMVLSAGAVVGFAAKKRCK